MRNLDGLTIAVLFFGQSSKKWRLLTLGPRPIKISLNSPLEHSRDLVKGIVFWKTSGSLDPGLRPRRLLTPENTSFTIDDLIFCEGICVHDWKGNVIPRLKALPIVDKNTNSFTKVVDRYFIKQPVARR